MTPRDLIEFFSEREITLTSTDLLSPNKDKMKETYYKIISSIMKIEDVTDIVMFKTVKNFLKNLGVGNFELKDFYSPDSKRSLFFLSVLANYLLFMDSKEEIKAEIQGNLEKIENEISEAKSQQIEKKKIIKTLKQNEIEDEIETKKLAKEEVELAEKLEKIKEELKKNVEDFEEKRNLKNAKLENFSSLKMEAEILKSEIKKYKENLITEYTTEENISKVQKEVQQKTDLMREDKRENKEIEEENQILQKKLSNLRKILKAAEKLKNTETRTKSEMEAIYEIRSLTEESEMEHENVLRRNEHLKAQILRLNCKIAEHEDNFEKKQAEINKEVQDSKIKYENFKEKQNSMDISRRELLNKIQNAEEKTLMKNNEYEREIFKVTNLLKDLEREIYEQFISEQ